MSAKKELRASASALAFILPNILGFLGFTLLPMLVSLVMAFSNWDLKLHNIYRRTFPSFTGFENLSRLFHEYNFWKYFGNTLYLMLGIPFGIALSLGAALLLTSRLDGGGPAAKKKLVFWAAVCGVGIVLGSLLLAASGAASAGMTLLLGGLAAAFLVTGSFMGSDLYRTLFYIPNFTAGVATFILWKKLYSPHTGPINQALEPVLRAVEGAVRHLPAWPLRALAWLCLAGMALLLARLARSLALSWKEGELGGISLGLGLLLLFLPALAAPFIHAMPLAGWLALGLGLGWAGWAVYRAAGSEGPDFPPPGQDAGLGRASILGLLGLSFGFALLGLSNLFLALPGMAAAGLDPPEWLASYTWAKPAMIFMGLWAAVGSQNMLLYIAAISNIPPELNEAAQIDGASNSQRFWHVTWPQLSPVTLFIVIMSVIGGLQGGFEVARTMTGGGPAGASTTLSYFIYTEGFETGRLGYASAVSWLLFLMVFIVTLFNWKFGNRYVDE